MLEEAAKTVSQQEKQKCEAVEHKIEMLKLNQDKTEGQSK